MDSPQPSKSSISSSAAALSSCLSPVQESPFSNFASNLSPIKHDKAPHVAPRFLGLNSPPLVFTSPRLNPFKRSQSFSVEVSQNSEGDEKTAYRPGDLEISVSELQKELIVDTREDDTKDSMSVQPSSPSGCVDDYLADPVEVDCASSAYSVDLNSKQSNNVVKLSANGLVCSKNLESDDKDKHDEEREVDAAQLFSGQSETFDVEPLKTKFDQHGGRGISDECLHIESDMFDLSSLEKESKYLNPQKVVEDDGYGCDGLLQLQCGSLKMAQAHEGFAENAEGVTDDPFYDMAHDLEEAIEHQRGMIRRCLQFGESQPEPTANCSSSPNLVNGVITSNPLATSSKTEGLGSSHVDSSATSRKGKLVNLSQLASNMILQSYDHRSSLTNSKPSGIGLHLNSLFDAIQTDQSGIPSMKLAVDSMGTQGIKSASITSYQSLENMESCSDASENVSTAPQDETHEAKVGKIAGSAASESLCTIESIECQTTLNTKMKLNSQDGESNEVFNQQIPKRKRKKLSDDTYGEGCKRCNCKKSKCLKLYCECFAAGIYCAEPCSCQGCFNKPEYEDKVLETRQQIESRNPLAFAPKVVQPFAEVPVNSREDGNWKTPSSARHKIGCNCKRSMCLKKYCECYQANVGCSLGCRCEGCKNVYGKKEDYRVTEEILKRGGGELSESTEATNKKDDPHYLTPMTPSVQYPDHEKNAPVSGLFPICLPSPECHSTKSLKTSNGNDTLMETSKENLYIGSYREGLNYNNADMLANDCHQTPLPKHPSFVIGSSSSKARELLNLGPRSGSFTSGGLRWRSSPVTPKSPIDGTKELEQLESDELYDILKDNTPEMLKDTSAPFKSVKSSSPNGKRVSPPHRLHQLGSSNSGPLRSGRKFMLKAVPSFPPLTPCIDSKGSSNESRSKFQDNSSND